MAADSTHYLASLRAYVSDLLQGMPNTERVDAMKDLYIDGELELTEARVNKLVQRILKHTHSRQGGSTRQKSSTNSNPKSQYGRPPGLADVQYRSMKHRRDDHVEKDQKCMAIDARRKGNDSNRTCSTSNDRKMPSAAAASADSDTETGSRFATILVAFANSFANSFFSNQNGDVNNDSSYPNPHPILDSACSHHMLRAKSAFKFLKPILQPIRVATKSYALAKGSGIGRLSLGKIGVDLAKSLWVPKLTRDIISASRLASEFDLLVKKDKFYVLPQDSTEVTKAVGTGSAKKGVYEFDHVQQEGSPTKRFAPYSIPKRLMNLHRTFAHANKDALNRLLRTSPRN